MDGNASGGAGGTTVAPDINGTTFYKVGRNSLDYLIKTSGGASHDIFLNAAAAWADVTAPGTGSFTGTIGIKWRYLGA
jgi:predicted molibdopterin-dependent oxidoreductase YjgC